MKYITQCASVYTCNKDVHSFIFLYMYIYVGGDQMIAARVRGSQRIRNNSDTDVDRLEGVTGVRKDWHAKTYLGMV